MNMINKNRVQNYINLIERCYVGFSPMIACLFEAGIPEYEIVNEISAVVYSFCTVAFYNIFKENMPADSEGQSEHIKGITNMILEYYKTINNYCHEEIVYSDKLSECAGIIHAIEEGTANQRQINQAFASTYNFVDFYDTDADRFRNADDLRKEVRGDYPELVEKIRTENPDVDEAYIPFIIADVLKEAYEREVN